MKLAEFLAHLAEEGGYPGDLPVRINTRSTCGDTPLHTALWARDDEAARELIAAGADVDAAGEEGYTPLQVAIAQGNVALTVLLWSRGAAWDKVNEFGTTARDMAMSSDWPGIRSLVEGRE
jgi:ankyrin repeat protein